MKPRLVDHMFNYEPPITKPIVSPHTTTQPVVKCSVIVAQPTNHTPLFINIFSILIMIIGGYCLYHRKISKEKNKQEHIQRIDNLYKGINLK